MATTKAKTQTLSMSKKFSVVRIPEPGLKFRYGQILADPHDGLTLFGPQDTDFPSHPKNITYALIGTQQGINAFAGFSQALTRPQFIDPAPQNSRLWPAYPGFEAIFHCVWPTEPAATHVIDADGLSNFAKHRDPNKRAYDVVNAYLDAIVTLTKRDEPLNVAICVVPDEVWLNCRPLSRVKNPIGSTISPQERKLRIAGQRGLFDDSDLEQYRLSPDFRRQIKARAMEHRIPIQIVRESTLLLTDKLDSVGVTPLSDRAWNLSTTLFYKSGGKPWRLATARESVCYVGLAFRKPDPSIISNTAVCAAQMFIDTGDGIVFLGEYGPWYSPDKKQFHLDKKAARNLLRGVLDTYEDLDGRPLKEIFLHSRSEINAEEFGGYQAACPTDAKLVGIRVSRDRSGLRLFREGRRPLVRGTLLILNDNSAFLWATGFKPELLTYDGWEVPVPLRIDIQHGDADIVQVATDILSLTKLNYNACKLGDSQPVTVGFSNAVGEILVSNPDIKTRRPQFKFYI